jgi:hypothetical protein
MALSIILVLAWLLILGLARRQFFHIALLGFPGVVLHELMHLVVGVVLLAKPTSMNLIPRRQGNAWLFGSVSFAGLNTFNAAPVAYAPLLLLGVAWLLFYHWMLPLFDAQHYLIWIVSGYVIGCAIFYSAPSITDMKVGGWSTVFWGVVVTGGWWLWTQSGYIH